MLCIRGILMLVLVVLVGAAPTQPNARTPNRCGNDLATQAFPHHRTRRDASQMDPRYKLPSEDVLRSPACAYEDEGVGQYGLSQCHVRRVINGYLSTTDWPSTGLKLGVITYAPATGAPWITAAEVTSAIGILNQAYAPARITFSHTLEQPVNQERFSYFTSNRVNVSTLDSVLAILAQDFAISSRQADREYAVYLAVVPTSYSDFVGLCFPIPALLQEISDTIPLYAGGVCLVDPAFVLSTTFSANAHPQSRGFTPAHEIGHALGLQHPHNSVSQPRQVGANPPRFSGCTNPSTTSSCVASDNGYETGDFISDLPPTPNPLSYVNVFDSNTCTASESFPSVCGSSERNLTATFLNYMSYYPEDCTDRFSPMQIARMRCVIDRFLLPVPGLVTPATRAVPPVAVVTARLLNTTAARIEWAPPLHLLFYSDTRPSSVPTPSDLSYVLERQPAFPGGPAIFNSQQFSFLDQTLTPNTTYNYRVHARTPQGDGVRTGFTAASTATSAAWAFYLSAPLAVGLIVLALLV